MDQALTRFERYLKRRFGQTGTRHQHLNTTQAYARIYDETLYEQFKTAMSRLEAIAVDDWQGVDASEPASTEVRAQDMPSGSMAPDLMKNGFLAKVDDNGPLELINDTQNLANLTSQDRLDPADGHLGLIQIETSYAASLINKVFYPHDLQSNERII